jgi:hypothetical protein
MDTALYFPHATIEDSFLLKSALLLWDNLEYISPGDWLRPNTNDRDVLEAIDIVGKPLYPNERIQQKVHQRVVDFFGKDGVSEKYVPVPESAQYHIYADKFAHRTWEFLSQMQLIDGRFALPKHRPRYPDFRVTERVAIILMAMLADELAGTIAQKVTDADYAQLTHAAVLARENGGNFAEAQPDHRTWVVKLLTPVLPVANLDLHGLVQIRKNESAFLRSLRENYRSAVDEYMDAVTAGNDFDFLRLIDAFRERMSGHLSELDRMFGRRNFQDLVSISEFVASGVCTGFATYLVSHNIETALVAGAAAAGVPSIFKLLGTIPANREKRENLLSENPAAWLYQVRQTTGGTLSMAE